MNKLTSFCILTTACLGGVSFLTFNNGFLLAFLSRLEMSGSDILTLLALPLMVQFVLVMPFGYLSDWFGKKFIGLLGMVFSGSGLFLLTFAGVAPFQPTSVVIVIGIVAFGVGTAMCGSNWFALLDPLVSEATRGRFFGKLRLTWQGFGVGCFALVTLMLERFPELETYRIVLGILVLFGFIRMLVFAKIPELEQPKPPSEPLWSSLKKIIKLPGYLPFCSYCFLLSLFTAASPQLFGLLEKEVLQLSDDQLVMLGNLMVAGALIGFVVGGNMVDRIGTKYVFLFCHFG
ncbi:MAG: MFS transporter, partial [SAR324 cluster bacterium]|nr:MFS transporter [SAR324 cluster bacterium]